MVHQIARLDIIVGFSPHCHAISEYRDIAIFRYTVHMLIYEQIPSILCYFFVPCGLLGKKNAIFNTE